MSDYSASSIRVLKDLEPVKERPGMYTRTTCPTHIVQEVIDNAADEALAGYAKRISVLIRADGVIEVFDNGRGIPIEIHPEEGRPAVELVFCKLHAGRPSSGWISTGMPRPLSETSITPSARMSTEMRLA